MCVVIPVMFGTTADLSPSWAPWGLLVLGSPDHLDVVCLWCALLPRTELKKKEGFEESSHRIGKGCHFFVRPPFLGPSRLPTSPEPRISSKDSMLGRECQQRARFHGLQPQSFASRGSDDDPGCCVVVPWFHRNSVFLTIVSSLSLPGNSSRMSVFLCTKMISGRSCYCWASLVSYC